MYKIFLLFLASFFFFSCQKEKFNQDVDDFRSELRPALKSLLGDNYLPSRDTVARSFLTEHATIQDLEQLMDCKYPMLRIIAYQTIVDRQEYEYFNLLLNHLSDTARVKFWFDEDILNNSQISSLMIMKANEDNGLSPIQKKQLIRTVLLQHPYLDISNSMIRDIEPDEEFYELIKNRAISYTQDCNKQLINSFALSKFNKKEDVNFLNQVFSKKYEERYCLIWVFKGIEQFPDERFYKILQDYYNENYEDLVSEDYVDEDIILYLTRAIAAYQNTEALKLLQNIEKMNSQFGDSKASVKKNKFIYKAMLINYDTIYKDYLNKMELQFDDFYSKYTRYSGKDLREYNDKPKW